MPLHGAQSYPDGLQLAKWRHDLWVVSPSPKSWHKKWSLSIGDLSVDIGTPFQEPERTHLRRRSIRLMTCCIHLIGLVYIYKSSFSLWFLNCPPLKTVHLH